MRTLWNNCRNKYLSNYHITFQEIHERNYPRKFTNYKCINGNNKSPVNIPDRAICASLTDPEVDQIKLKLYGKLSMRSIVPL